MLNGPCPGGAFLAILSEGDRCSAAEKKEISARRCVTGPGSSAFARRAARLTVAVCNLVRRAPSCAGTEWRNLRRFAPRRRPCHLSLSPRSDGGRSRSRRREAPIRPTQQLPCWCSRPGAYRHRPSAPTQKAHEKRRRDWEARPKTGAGSSSRRSKLLAPSASFLPIPTFFAMEKLMRG